MGFEIPCHPFNIEKRDMTKSTARHYTEGLTLERLAAALNPDLPEKVPCRDYLRQYRLMKAMPGVVYLKASDIDVSLIQGPRGGYRLIAWSDAWDFHSWRDAQRAFAIAAHYSDLMEYDGTVIRCDHDRRWSMLGIPDATAQRLRDQRETEIQEMDEASYQDGERPALPGWHGGILASSNRNV